MNQTFNPARGGHAPGHIRERFQDAVEQYVQFEDGQDGYKELCAELHDLSGKLWNCTDQMPNLLRSDFEELLGRHDPTPYTYSQGARFLRGHLEKHSKQEAA